MQSIQTLSVWSELEKKKNLIKRQNLWENALQVGREQRTGSAGCLLRSGHFDCGGSRARCRWQWAWLRGGSSLPALLWPRPQQQQQQQRRSCLRSWEGPLSAFSQSAQARLSSLAEWSAFVYRGTFFSLQPCFYPLFWSTFGSELVNILIFGFSGQSFPVFNVKNLVFRSKISISRSIFWSEVVKILIFRFSSVSSKYCKNLAFRQNFQFRGEYFGQKLSKIWIFWFLALKFSSVSSKYCRKFGFSVKICQNFQFRGQYFGRKL